MKGRVLLAAAAVLIIGLAGAVLFLRDEAPRTLPPISRASLPPPAGGTLPVAPGMPSSPPTVAPPILTPDRAQPAEVTPQGVRLLPGARDIAGELNDWDQPPEHDLEILDGVLSEFRRVFGQNPPGGLNGEITAALLGANARRLAVLPQGMPALNSSGELVDRWNTPYYFHPVSRTIMEVLSAGPDGQLWTPDDVGTINPAGVEVREEF